MLTIARGHDEPTYAAPRVSKQSVGVARRANLHLRNICDAPAMHPVHSVGSERPQRSKWGASRLRKRAVVMTAAKWVWAWRAVVLAVVASLQASACAGSHSAAGASIIRIDGSSTVFAVTEAVAEEFQKINPNVR